MIRLTESDPFAWPEDTRIADLRADLAAPTARLDDMCAGLTEAIAYAERHGGLCPVGQLRALLTTKEKP